MTLTVRPRPCVTCPYRRDVPSGIWSADEYDKLPRYDNDIPDQLAAGATGVFSCHSTPDLLCAGWVGCHNMHHNLAVRLHWRDLNMDAVLAYVCPVPLFSSGREAAEHGLRDLASPGQEARRRQEYLLRVIARRTSAPPGRGRDDTP